MSKLQIKKRIWVPLASLLLAGAIFGGSYLLRVNRYQTQMRELSVDEVDLSVLADGVYTGSYDADMVAVSLPPCTVEVTVQGGRLTAVTLLEHRQGRGKPAERLTDDIVARQRIGVDTVTGATNSSKAIQKAVELALRGAAQ